MRVLIIEDNLGDQRVLKEAFARNYPAAELVFADDAELAMKILQPEKSKNGWMPCFILLDLNLPKKSGKEFLKELKTHKILRKIPVLVLTSSEAESDVSECYSMGASCYLKKPMKFSEFQSLVESMCKFWLKQVTYAKAG